ncbi:hypothetical protein H0H81_012357 [Sphagnurus paluster]|uniref:Uncharacterized protein n=1 Tax=Sphagnurus paluster TaxID=117069 RepID=A0A9P7KKD7_9AGAR|nr:hypothetical protein H0H81_012357 [Sphagnurus paluster]
MPVPSVSLFATLSFFARQETLNPAFPQHIEARGAEIAPRDGPTPADIKHFIEHCHTNFAHFPAFDFGIPRDHVDISSRRPMRPLTEPRSYKLGTLTGNWQGSYIYPYLEDYTAWLDTLAAPPEFPTTGRFPLYMSLQEHFTCDPGAVIPRVDKTVGTSSAWLPAGFHSVQREVR